MHEHFLHPRSVRHCCPWGEGEARDVPGRSDARRGHVLHEQDALRGGEGQLGCVQIHRVGLLR